MPEGDTIHRAAAALRIALVGKPITSFEAPRLIGPHPAKGRVIERVESHGKHLEIVWDDGLTLHTHMRMTGTWHLYRIGEPWRRPVRQLRVLIEVSDWLAVCFNAPVVETYRHFDRRRHPGFGPLGPDLCKADADLDECINALYHYTDTTMPVGEVLLDQHAHLANGTAPRLTDPVQVPGAGHPHVRVQRQPVVPHDLHVLAVRLDALDDPPLGRMRPHEPGRLEGDDRLADQCDPQRRGRPVDRVPLRHDPTLRLPAEPPVRCRG